MAIKSSESYLDFLRNEEGFIPKAKPDLKTGKLVVGIGKQTTNPNEVVTREKAEADMRDYIAGAEKELSGAIKRDNLSQGQMDTLVDMHYNMGLGGMKDFIDLVNTGDDARASQELLKYTKAWDEDKKAKVDVPALQARVQKRKAMWDANNTTAAVQPELATRNILADSIGSVKAQTPQVENNNELLASVNAVKNGQFEMSQEGNPDRRRQALMDGAALANPEEALRHTEARRLSDKYGMPYQEARDSLLQKDYNTIVTEQGHDLIAEHFPEVAEWVNRDPNNYVMLRESGPWAPKVVTAARKLRPDTRGDWEKSLSQNPLMAKEALVYLGMMTGHLSKDEAAKHLEDIDLARQANALTSKSSQSFEAIFHGKDAGALDKLKAVFKYPEDAMKVMAQSQGSTVAVMGASLLGGAAGTATGGPAIGVAGGAISAYTMSHILSFAEHMTKQLDEFRDPITGRPNVKLAFSDEARVKKWVREADIYGLTMGVADAVFSMISGPLGEGIAKSVMKGTGSKIASKVAGGTAEMAGKAFEEGGSQFAALQAVDFHRGDGFKNIKENYKEGLDEAILSTGPAAGMTAIKYGAAKTAAILSKSSKANEDLVAVSNLKAEIDKNPEAKKNPSAAKDLVKEALNTEPVADNINDPIVEDVEKTIPAEEATMKRQAAMDTTAVSPREFEAHFGSRDEALKFLREKFSQDVVDEYARARASDSSVHIPTSDWVFAIEDRPELDAVARFNGNEYNGHEANANIEKVEENPTTFFDQSEINVNPYDGAFNLIEDREKVLKLRKQAELVNSLAVRAMNLRSNDPDSSPESLKTENPFVQKAIEEWLTERNKLVDSTLKEGLEPTDSELSKEFDFIRNNPVQARELLKKLVDNHLRVLEDRAENSTGSEEGTGGIDIIEADPNDPQNLKLRPVQLYNRFRDDAEKAVFFSLLSRLKKALPKGTDQKMIEAWTEIQFEKMQHRAALLNTSITEVAKKLKIGKTKGKYKEEAYGTFSWLPKKDANYTVAFTYDGDNKADTKTVVHEFAHSYLHEMAIDYAYIVGIPDESKTDAQKAYLRSMQIAAEAFGLDSIDKLLEMNLVEADRIHETFARTAELYFLEGNIENAGMRRMLEDFRKYVVAVIHRIKSVFNTSIYPPLKLTPDLERMFEGIMGASNSLEEHAYPMFPEPLFDAKILGENGQKYIEIIKDARDEAMGKAYTRIWNKSIREREKMIDGAIDKITAEATDDVDSRRAMIMLAQFKELYKEYKTDAEGDTPDPRLSFDSVMKILCNNDLVVANKLKDLVPREMIAGKKKGGMPVEVFMQMNGMENPTELFDMLVETSQRDQMIEERIDQKIKTEFPQFKSDDEIHEIVVNAIQNKGKERLLLEEVKILMEKHQAAFKTLVSKLINPPAYIGAPSKEAFKSEGEKLVNDANAMKFSAMKFLNDAGRHGRDAARSYRKNNFIEALDSKMKEALHFFAYKHAVRAQKAVAGVTARIRAFDKYARSKDLARKYDADIMAFGKQITQLAAVGQEIPEFSREHVSEMSGVSDDMIGMVNKRIEEYEKARAGRYGKNASVSGYVAFGDVLRTVMAVAREAKTVELKGRKEDIVNVADAIKEEIGEGDTADVSEDTLMGRIRRDTGTVRSLFESLYPSAEAFAQSTLGRLFYSVVNAEAIRSLELMKYKDMLSAAIRLASEDRGIMAPIISRLPMPAKWKIDYLDKSARPVIISIGKDKEGKSKNFTFKNKGALHMANLLMGSESGAMKFLMGHNLTVFNEETLAFEPDFDGWNKAVEKMIADGVLTKKHFEMYSAIWKIFEMIHPLVKTAMRRSDHFNMGKIEGWKVRNSLGEFDGGYVPVSPLKDIMSAGKIDSMLDVDTMGYEVNELYPNMNTGMSNERTKAYPELNLDMSRITSYLSAALNIAYLRNPLLDFGKVVETPQVRQALETRRPGIIGSAKDGVIVRWFNGVKMQEYTEYKGGWQQSISRTLRNNVNTAMYLGGFTTMVKQYFGYLPTAGKLDKKYFGTVGLARIMYANVKTGMGASKAHRQYMMDKSPVMRNRMANSQEMMTRSFEKLDTNFDWISWTAEKVNDFRWFLIQMTQNQVDVCTWYAAFDKAVNQGMNEQHAVNYADDIVNTTQSSPDVSSMSNISRGDDFHKLLMMVTSVPIAMHNLMQVEGMRDQSKTARAKGIIVIGMLAWLLPNMLDGIFAEMTDDDDDLDDEEAMEKAMKAMTIRTATGAVDTALPSPIVRTITSMIQFSSGSASPGLSKPANSVAKSIQAGKNWSNDVDLSAKEIAGLMDTLTIFTALPASILGKIMGYADYLQDTEVKEDQKRDRRRQLSRARRH